LAAIQQQHLRVDILDHYLAGLPDTGGWITWNTDANGQGAYVTQFAQTADALGAVPMFSLYQMADWGDGNLAGLVDHGFMTSYWQSAKILFQRLAAYGKPALVSLEPDFWGYAELSSTNDDPTTVPAFVSDEGAECSAFGDHVAGVAQCLVQLARRLAPNVSVGFLPSRWGANTDATVAAFMTALHAGDADFIAIETLDRDAGCFEVQAPDCQKPGFGYWSTADFQNHLAMAKLFHDTIGRPLVWWQTPLGVPSDTPGGTVNAYRDNHVAYFFSNPGQLVSVGGAAMVFGAGASSQTQLTTDGGQFKRATDGYFANPVPLP
jgi:hypothetical protein